MKIKPTQHRVHPIPGYAGAVVVGPGALAPGWAMVAADCSLAQSPRFQAGFWLEAGSGKTVFSRLAPPG